MLRRTNFILILLNLLIRRRPRSTNEIALCPKHNWIARNSDVDLPDTTT